MNIGFAGIGLMGNPMAKNILKAGHTLYIYNRTNEKTKELQALGANTTGTPKELAQNTNIIITMVTDTDALEEVLFGKIGVVQASHKNLTVIDMSTIGPTSAKIISKKLKKYGIQFIDAPVTGGTSKAATGELTIFAGGESDDFKKVKNVLECMGKNINYMGNVGSGQALKLINNFLMAAHIEALAESMLFADAMNVSRQNAAKALTNSPTISDNAKSKIKNFTDNNFPLTFSMANMRKDLGIALSEMKKEGYNFPNMKLVESLYNKADKSSNGEQQDFTTIIRQLIKKTDN